MKRAGFALVLMLGCCEIYAAPPEVVIQASRGVLMSAGATPVDCGFGPDHDYGMFVYIGCGRLGSPSEVPTFQKKMTESRKAQGWHIQKDWSVGKNPVLGDQLTSSLATDKGAWILATEILWPPSEKPVVMLFWLHTRELTEEEKKKMSE
jgi:hypothetical protein